MELSQIDEIPELKKQNIQYWREITQLENKINQMKQIIYSNNEKIENLCEHCFEIEIEKYEQTLYICKICGYTK